MRISFLKAGDLFVNLANVSMVRVTRSPHDHEQAVEVLVYFHKDKRARLRGDEARSLLRYLDSSSVEAPGEGPTPGDGKVTVSRRPPAQ